MAVYPGSARERAMKAQEVILRFLSKQVTYWQAAKILRVSPRHLRRIYERYRRPGYDGLYDRRRGMPSPKRVPVAVVEQVLGLYRENLSDSPQLRRQSAISARSGQKGQVIVSKRNQTISPVVQQRMDVKKIKQ
jgi:Homeodomain-like domain